MIGTWMGRVAQDGELQFFRQDKVKGWGDPIRAASGLEARYMIVEAQNNPAEMLAFVNERRAVGNRQPLRFAGTVGNELPAQEKANDGRKDKEQ